MKSLSMMWGQDHVEAAGYHHKDVVGDNHRDNNELQVKY
jgi:hypothetical protein